MITTKISESEIQPLAVASLPTRPTAPTAFGGRGYSAAEMKACFDKLPRLIIERLNQLIEELSGDFVPSIVYACETGIAEGQTLADFFLQFRTGELASLFPFDSDGTTIGEVLPDLIRRVDEMSVTDENYVLDGGSPAQRQEVS